MQMCFVHLPCWDREHSWLKGLVYCQRWRAPWARYFMRWFMRGNLLVVRECIWHIVNNNNRFMLLIFGFGFDERQYLHSISICMKMSLLGNNNVNWKEILSTQQIANSYKSHNNFLRGYYVLKIAIKYNLSDTFLCVCSGSMFSPIIRAEWRHCLKNWKCQAVQRLVEVVGEGEMSMMDMF